MVSVSKIKYIQLGELRLQITANLGKETSEVGVIVGDFLSKSNLTTVYTEGFTEGLA